METIIIYDELNQPYLVRVDGTRVDAVQPYHQNDVAGRPWLENALRVLEN